MKKSEKAFLMLCAADLLKRIVEFEMLKGDPESRRILDEFDRRCEPVCEAVDNGADGVPE